MAYDAAITMLIIAMLLCLLLYAAMALYDASALLLLCQYSHITPL